MEILKEKDGVLITPYTKEQFKMIRDFATDWSFTRCEASKIDKTTIDHIYDCLNDLDARMKDGTDSWNKEKVEIPFQFVMKNITPEDMKEFILKYARLQTEVTLKRETTLYQCFTVTHDELPEDLDKSDWDAVSTAAKQFADGHHDGWHDDDEYTDESEVSIQWEIHTCGLDRFKIGYDGVPPTEDQKVECYV